jgi:hypothetical protein
VRYGSGATTGDLLRGLGPAADAGWVEFWTIEVAHGAEMSALRWKDAHGERLVEAALTHGAKEWAWVTRDWGVLLELGFDDESDWLRFRATAAVQAAMDAVPDPVNGLLIYSGRGGSSAAGVVRHPRPVLGAGAAALPEPEPEPLRPPLGTQHGRFVPPDELPVQRTPA